MAWPAKEVASVGRGTEAGQGWSLQETHLVPERMDDVGSKVC